MLKIKYISNLLLLQVIALNSASCNPGTSSELAAPAEQTEPVEQKEIAFAAEESTQASSGSALVVTITPWSKKVEELMREYNEEELQEKELYKSWIAEYERVLNELHIQPTLHCQQRNVSVINQVEYDRLAKLVLKTQQIQSREIILYAKVKYEDLYKPIVENRAKKVSLEFELLVAKDHRVENYTTKKSLYDDIVMNDNQQRDLLREYMAIVRPHSLIPQHLKAAFEATFVDKTNGASLI